MRTNHFLTLIFRGEKENEDSEVFGSSQPINNLDQSENTKFMINTKLCEPMEPSHNITGNENGQKAGTKELLVYSRRKLNQGNETETSQHCQESEPQTIQNFIEIPGNPHIEPTT